MWQSLSTRTLQLPSERVHQDTVAADVPSRADDCEQQPLTDAGAYTLTPAPDAPAAYSRSHRGSSQMPPPSPHTTHASARARARAGRAPASLDLRRGYEALDLKRGYAFPPNQVNDSNKGSNGPAGSRSGKLHSEARDGLSVTGRSPASPESNKGPPG